MDPISDRFAWASVYNYAENRVPNGVDLWGLQYLDANLNFQIDESNKKISISGKLEVSAKLINLSSINLSNDILTHQAQKASRLFDFMNEKGGITNIPLHPVTGNYLNEEYNLTGKIDVDFKFQPRVYNSLSDIKSGDFAVIVVDNIAENTAGRASKNGHSIVLNGSAFSMKNNLLAHEFGHAFGDLADLSSPKSNIMTNSLSTGMGEELKTSQRFDILRNVIYNIGLNKGRFSNPNNDTKGDAEHLLKKGY